MHYRGDKIASPILLCEIRLPSSRLTVKPLPDFAAFSESRQGGPNATSSMLKYYGCELNKRRYELFLAGNGEPGAWLGRRRV